MCKKNWDGVIKVTYLDELTSANELKQLCDGVWVECAYGVCWELKPGHFAHIDCSAMWPIIRASQCQRVSWWPTSRTAHSPLLTAKHTGPLSPWFSPASKHTLYFLTPIGVSKSSKTMKTNNKKISPVGLVDFFLYLNHLCSLCCLSSVLRVIVFKNWKLELLWYVVEEQSRVHLLSFTLFSPLSLYPTPSSADFCVYSSPDINILPLFSSLCLFLTFEMKQRPSQS